MSIANLFSNNMLDLIKPKRRIKRIRKKTEEKGIEIFLFLFIKSTELDQRRWTIKKTSLARFGVILLSLYNNDKKISLFVSDQFLLVKRLTQKQTQRKAIDVYLRMISSCMYMYWLVEGRCSSENKEHDMKKQKQKEYLYLYIEICINKYLLIYFEECWYTNTSISVQKREK